MWNAYAATRVNNALPLLFPADFLASSARVAITKGCETLDPWSTAYEYDLAVRRHPVPLRQTNSIGAGGPGSTQYHRSSPPSQNSEYGRHRVAPVHREEPCDRSAGRSRLRSHEGRIVS